MLQQKFDGVQVLFAITVQYFTRASYIKKSLYKRKMEAIYTKYTLVCHLRKENLRRV